MEFHVRCLLFVNDNQDLNLSFLTLPCAFGISGSLIWSETLMTLIFNPCGEFRWSPEGPGSQMHSPHLHVGAPGIFSDLLRSVQMLKRDWGVEKNGKLLHLSIPSKTAAWVSEFVVEYLPLSRTAAWFLSLQWRTCPWAEYSWWCEYTDHLYDFLHQRKHVAAEVVQNVMASKGAKI